MKLKSVYIVSVLFFVAAAGVSTTHIHTPQRIRAKNTVLVPGGFYSLVVISFTYILSKLSFKKILDKKKANLFLTNHTQKILSLYLNLFLND